MTTATNQNEKFLELRETYYQLRHALKTQIKEHETKIARSRLEVSKLEEEIKKSRPILPGAEKICEKCDIISMEYDGIIPGQGSRIRVYACMICGYVDGDT